MVEVSLLEIILAVFLSRYGFLCNDNQILALNNSSQLYFWLNLSTILYFGALGMKYDQINVRNGFLMLKLFKYCMIVLITLIAQKLRIWKLYNFLTVSGCGIFRVSTVGKYNQNPGNSMGHVPKI